MAVLDVATWARNSAGPLAARKLPYRVQVKCPNCKLACRLGGHGHQFEVIPFPDGAQVLCRDCNVPAQTSRVVVERPF
jgi:hypothetical protein